MLSHFISKNVLLYVNRIKYFYRLVKPNISQYKSFEQLQYDRKQRELQLIQQQNLITLNTNKLFTKQKLVSSLLNTSQQISQGILKRHLNFSAISPKSLKHNTLQLRFSDSHIQYPFSLQQVESGLPQLNAIPMHYSYKRGVPIINEYEMDKKIAYVFNLPQQFNTKDISQKLGIEAIKQIKVQYCRLGLPAYAKIYFNSDQAVTNLVLNNKTYIQINGRICYLKTHFDKDKLELKNRRLVIHDLEQNENDLIFYLSKYGRVVHLDYPTFISRNPSIQEVRNKYKNSQQLIRINYHRKDGSIDYEYYPSLEQSYKMNTLQTERDFDINLIQKKQRLQAMYKNRMRYAEQINVYEGKQNQINIENMNYCIVTFSCTEQAQNCYFNLRFDHKIFLFDSKTTQQFQIDTQYRKRILRFIDNQYQKTKINQQNNKNILQKQLEEYFDQLSMFDKLVQLQNQQSILKKSLQENYQDQPEILIAYFNQRVKQIKHNLQRKLGSKSFDQLAQKQLFGRVLPKKDPKQPNIKIDVLPQNNPQIQSMIQQGVIQDLSIQGIKQRDNYYRRLKVRQIKRMGLKQMNAQQQIQVAEGQQGQNAQADVQQQHIEDYQGKRGFSTLKKRAQSFRNRTSLELANYILRYCQYIKTIINQYQGIFPQSRFSMTKNGTFLNPEALVFSDNTSYITQEDLPKFLQCMRTFSQSQNVYTEFWKDYEYFKSRNIDLNEYQDKVRNNQFEALRRYFDSGCVKEVYEVQQGQDLDKKILTLNSTIAGFGQQYKKHVDQNGKQTILKISKVQNICPLDRINKIASAKHKFQLSNQITPKRKQLFNKYKYQILQTGQIPSEVRQEWNIDNNKTLDDLFEELASEAGIYKKDIQMILNLQNYTQQQIGRDIGLQIQLQKSRIAQRQSRASDYAKDPSNIQIRDKQGFFKVSKFRQI